MTASQTHDRHIEISTRPIRYAYILGSEPDNSIIIKIISNCCEALGGSHNIIIPSNGKAFDNCWTQFIIAADPDVIFLCGNFDDATAIKSQLSSIDIQPFAIKTLHGELTKTSNFTHYSPLPVVNVYKARIAEATGAGKKPIIVMPTRRGKNVDLIDYFNFGILSRQFVSEFKQFTQFSTPNKVQSEKQYSIIDPTEICSENLTHDEWDYFNAAFEDTVLGPYVAVTGNPNSLADCCLFWNWRALTSRHFFVRWVNNSNLNILYEGEFYNQAVLKLQPAAKLLTSYSIGLSNSETAKDILSSVTDYSNKSAKVGFSYKHPSEYDGPLAMARYFCAREHTSISANASLLLKRVITPPYDYDDCMFKDLILDLEIKSGISEDKSGIAVSHRLSVDDVFAMEQDLYGVEFRVNSPFFTILLPGSISTGSISVRINSDWDIISNYCKRKGLEIVESPSGKHIRRAIELSASIEDLSNYYLNDVARRILSTFEVRHTSKVSLSIRNRELYRRSFFINDLKDTVIHSFSNISSYQKAKARKEVDRLVDLWWKKGILVSGFELKCEYCNFHSWYPIDIVGEKYKCLRCQTENKRPYYSQVHYRLHESFYQAHWENMIVPILSLYYLKNRSITDSFIYSVPVCIEPANPESSEIDFIAIIDGEVVIAECKKPNILDKKVFTLYSKIAKQVNAHRILFSSITREKACNNQDCRECQKHGENYSDETFTHGITNNELHWGTRERIKDYRVKMAQEGILVDTLCSYDLGISKI